MVLMIVDFGQVHPPLEKTSKFFTAMGVFFLAIMAQPTHMFRILNSPSTNIFKKPLTFFSSSFNAYALYQWVVHPGC